MLDFLGRLHVTECSDEPNKNVSTLNTNYIILAETKYGNFDQTI